jgi:hypothetical protein
VPVDRTWGVPYGKVAVDVAPGTLAAVADLNNLQISSSQKNVAALLAAKKAATTLQTVHATETRSLPTATAPEAHGATIASANGRVAVSTTGFAPDLGVKLPKFESIKKEYAVSNDGYAPHAPGGSLKAEYDRLPLDDSVKSGHTVVHFPHLGPNHGSLKPLAHAKYPAPGKYGAGAQDAWAHTSGSTLSPGAMGRFRGSGSGSETQ